MRYLTIIMALLTFLLLSLLVSQSRAGELYVAGDALSSQCARPAVDGTWKQDRITGGSGFACSNLAWDAGVGYRLGDGPDLLTDNWSVELGYRDYGSAMAGGRWVSDDDYRQTAEHGEAWLDHHGVERHNVRVVDDLHGGYGRIAKGFLVGPVEPYVAVGWFGGVHTVRHRSHHDQEIFQGVVAGPTVGGGVKWNIWNGIKARAGAEFLQTMVEDGNPISSRYWTVGGGIEVPLSWLGGTGVERIERTDLQGDRGR